MKTTLFLLALLSTPVMATCNPDEKAAHAPKVEESEAYGAQIELKEQAPELGEVIASYERYENQPIQMEAKVINVCQTKGCWMALSSNTKEEVRVRFKDYGFFVPISLVGKTVRVEGELKREQISEKLAKHFKEDAGASQSEIEAVQGPVYEYTFTASGVRVL